MGVILDLTARTVVYITLIQDAIQQEDPTIGILKNPLLTGETNELLEKIKSAVQKNKHLQKRIIEVSLTGRITPDQRVAEKEFYKRSQVLLIWLKERNKVIQDKLEHFLSLIKSDLINNVGSVITPSYPPPHQWREAIRSYLYEHPNERISLAQSLEYLPLLIVLALGGNRYTAKKQRVLQEWYKFGEYNDEKLTKKEIELLSNWLTHNRTVDAEELLVNDRKLLRVLLRREIPLPFEVILDQELMEIQASRNVRLKTIDQDKHPVNQEFKNINDPLRKAEEMHLWGLALSGGGIRSATFNLGIVQGLAKYDLIQKFDYLSTVSGGGYIGSWLTTWIKRNGSINSVISRLNPDVSRDPRGDEVRPIRWLRMYSNYLTPNASIMSIDSWTMGLTWVRNTLLIQLIILLLLCVLFSFGAILLKLWRDLNWQNADPIIVLYLSMAILLPGALLAGWGMHTFDMKLRPPNPFKPHNIKWLRHVLLGMAFIAAFLTSGWLYPNAETDFCAGCTIKERTSSLLPTGLVGFLCLILVAFLGRYDAALPAQSSPNKKLKEIGAYTLLILSSAVASGVGVFLLACTWEIFNAIPNLKTHDYVTKLDIDLSQLKNLSRIGFTIGVPMILEVISLTVVLRMALLGRLFPDERREWWGRMGAMLHRLSFFWLLITGSALLGTLLVKHLLKHQHEFTGELAITGSWVALVGTAVRFAFSSKVNGTSDSKNFVASTLDAFVRFAPYLFGFGFLLIASKIVYSLLGYPNFEFARARTETYELEWAIKLSIFFLTLTVIFIWRVGVNEFSMHYFYRNRLTRAYLGATRRQLEREKSSNTFTGFDKADDIKLNSIKCSKGYYGPLPIINTTLNATQVSDLDRQDRKAESFIFTPLFCGFDIARTRASANQAGQAHDYGYRPTGHYAYYPYGGPTVGTAMAISGAAANPNKGYHSSPATAFLLTAFNVRLGWWMGNPRRNKSWKRADPAYGLAYVIGDLFGRTSTDKNYVCLSDGGHFDNMGLYELIRRRCRTIILGDAEQDAKFTCEGFANAIRRCRIDFGVEIQIDLLNITNRKENIQLSTCHYAVGNIWYPGDPQNRPSGRLLYIKSSLTGDEPVDINEYSLINPKFPHQSTADQFFDESQFESYRLLGLHIVETLMRDPKVKL